MPRRGVGGQCQNRCQKDAIQYRQFMDLLKELHNGGSTICMVTHDPRYAQHADREIHLFDGKLVEETIAADV